MRALRVVQIETKKITNLKKRKTVMIRKRMKKRRRSKKKMRKGKVMMGVKDKTKWLMHIHPAKQGSKVKK